MPSIKNYWDLIEPIWEDVSIYDGPAVFDAQFEKISEKQKALLASHWAQSEIRNGGFCQFFTNSTGVLGLEAVEGFRAMGMNRCADIVSTALGVFGDTYPRNRSEREAIVDTWTEDNPVWDELFQLDEGFFEAIASEQGGYEQAATDYANSEPTPSL